jgi:drug/metabolite transporter (DMT)-like permease
MIVFETLFALLYAFIYDQRLPRPLEIAAILLLVAGVCWSVRQHADDDSSGAASLGDKARDEARIAAP